MHQIAFFALLCRISFFTLFQEQCPRQLDVYFSLNAENIFYALAERNVCIISSIDLPEEPRQKLHQPFQQQFFLLWPWTLSLNLDLWTRPRYSQGKPASQIVRSSSSQIIMLHRMQRTRMWPIAMDKVAWFVCMCVCLLVMTVSPWALQNGEMLFGIWTREGPPNHALDVLLTCCWWI